MKISELNAIDSALNGDELAASSTIINYNSGTGDTVTKKINLDLLANSIIPALPATTGSYALQVTITNEVPSYTWVSLT